MRQRKPHGADLLPARCDAVKDAACDDEVAAGVVVTEREAKAVVVNGGDRSGEACDRGERGRKAATGRR